METVRVVDQLALCAISTNQEEVNISQYKKRKETKIMQKESLFKRIDRMQYTRPVAFWLIMALLFFGPSLVIMLPLAIASMIVDGLSVFWSHFLIGAKEGATPAAILAPIVVVICAISFSAKKK